MPDLRQGEIPRQERFTRSGGIAAEQAIATPETQERKQVMQAVAGSSLVESLAGAATAVLAIIALSTTANTSFYCLTIATIVAGAALIVHGAGMAGRLNEFMLQDSNEDVELGTGVTVEVLGGVAGVVLGILALINIHANILTPIAVIVFGASLLLSSGAVADMNELRLFRANIGAATRRMTYRATVGAAGIQALAGIAIGVLGILALVNVNPPDTTLVGLLATGCVLLVTGGVLSTRMLTFLGKSW